MRLAVTILWYLGALFWLPWLALLVRWVVDIALGVPWNESDYIVYVLGGLRPQFHWLGPWVITTWIPFGALLGIALIGLGWRLYWLDSEGMLRHPSRTIFLTLFLPPLAPFIMWRDARARYLEGEAQLEDGVRDARNRSRGSVT